MTMLKKLPPTIPIAAALVLSLGVGAAAHSPERAPDIPISCGVSVTDLGRMVQLSAHLATDTAVEGRYELSVNQTGRNGSAQINQGGLFQVEAGGRTILGEVTLGGNAGQYQVDLILHWDGLRLRCPTQDTDI